MEPRKDENKDLQWKRPQIRLSRTQKYPPQETWNQILIFHKVEEVWYGSGTRDVAWSSTRVKAEQASERKLNVPQVIFKTLKTLDVWLTNWSTLVRLIAWSAVSFGIELN